MIIKFRSRFLKELKKTEKNRRSENERRMRAVIGFKKEHKLNDLLLIANIFKTTFYYWKSRLDRLNPDKEIENKIIQIRAKIRIKAIVEYMLN
ncbi:hypothetical protein [Mycoplasma bradburyae]|uniref:Transposase n=1 Tax=Mycoplasma bradburyae TaxID=2963128 RepID=A0ABT5GB94_9MOLU|nr:hypothetical protein [Mycoplasma bradburyae]MDC4182247.1 hypothetical protein [Mycoplasma bradburyae]UTS70070.1 hypothetical protein NMG68_03540 [Mycoplasma bradburyae]